MTQFFGKYRGTVENNIDPLNLGRIQVSCPAVLGTGRMSWAMPCAPYAGSGVGFFAVPPTGANIWVEFEAGDRNKPIWTGCFWDTGQVPKLPALPAFKVFKTDCITLTLSDLPGIGGFTLEVQPPAVPIPLKLTFDQSGIELSNGAVPFKGSFKITPLSVSLNETALVVKNSPT